MAPVIQVGMEFREEQKEVEKELKTCIKGIDHISKTHRKKKKKPPTNEESLQYLDKFLKRIEKLEKRVEVHEGNQQKNLDRLDERINVLREGAKEMGWDQEPKREIETHKNSVYWKEALNRHLVDYFLREGHYDTAKMLAQKTNIESFVELDLFEDAKEVIFSLTQKSCKKALLWCTKHHSRISKFDIELEFHLRCQEFIELVRQGKNMEAIEYSREHLQMYFDKQSTQIQRLMACIVFGPSTTQEPYEFLFREERWTDLIQRFQQCHLKLNGLSPHPTLNIIMQAGIAALKTPLSEFDQNIDDPLCHDTFKDLASDLPFAIHPHSKLVCKLSGKLMTEDNCPMILPSGNVYSKEAIEEKLVGKKFKDPFDPKAKPVAFDDLRKAFIM